MLQQRRGALRVLGVHQVVRNAHTQADVRDVRAVERLQHHAGNAGGTLVSGHGQTETRGKVGVGGGTHHERNAGVRHLFGGGAESVTNLLGGHIDAMAQASNNAIPFYQAGKMRILGLSTEKRSGGLPDVPTFREQGYNVVIDGWYVFVGPKRMTPAQVSYWDDIFARTLRTDEWKKFVASSGWEPGYKNSQETATYLKREYDEAKGLLTELGLAK